MLHYWEATLTLANLHIFKGQSMPAFCSVG